MASSLISICLLGISMSHEKIHVEILVGTARVTGVVSADVREIRARNHVGILVGSAASQPRPREVGA